MDATTYQDYVNILHEELVPAMGCTEPIAIAYAAAVARQTLGRPAQRMEVEASGNIIKNVKSVFVPNTGGLRGIPAAAAAGMAAGDPALELEVLSSIGEGEHGRHPAVPGGHPHRREAGGFPLYLRHRHPRLGRGGQRFGAHCQLPYQHCAGGEKRPGAERGGGPGRRGGGADG